MPTSTRIALGRCPVPDRLDWTAASLVIHSDKEDCVACCCPSPDPPKNWRLDTPPPRRGREPSLTRRWNGGGLSRRCYPGAGGDDVEGANQLATTSGSPASPLLTRQLDWDGTRDEMVSRRQRDDASPLCGTARAPSADHRAGVSIGVCRRVRPSGCAKRSQTHVVAVTLVCI